MEKLTTMLLTGAAMTGLAVAPAVAGPHFPNVAVRTPNGVISLKGIPHYKTTGLDRPHNTSTTSYTLTYYKYTYTGLTRTQFYKKGGVDLGGFEFYTLSTGTAHHCINYPGQKFKAVATGGAGKAKLGTPVSSHVTIYSGTKTSTRKVHCTGTLTFPQVDYQLKSKTATHTSVQLNDHLKFKSHYTTTTTTTTTVKHRMHKHKHKHKHTENFTGREVWNLGF